MSRGGHIDDSAGFTFLQQIHQLVSEPELSQIIDGKSSLQSITSYLSFQLEGSCVVNKNIQMVVAFSDLVRQFPDILSGRQFSREELQARVAGRAANLLQHLLSF